MVKVVKEKIATKRKEMVNFKSNIGASLVVQWLRI